MKLTGITGAGLENRRQGRAAGLCHSMSDVDGELAEIVAGPGGEGGDDHLVHLVLVLGIGTRNRPFPAQNRPAW
jgi:hypothetical protein